MIKLTDGLYLDADQYNYVVGKPRQRKGQAGGRVELTETQYFTTVASALSAALSRAMHAEVENETITTLQGFIDRQQQMIADFTALIEPLYGRYAVV